MLRDCHERRTQPIVLPKTTVPKALALLFFGCIKYVLPGLILVKGHYLILALSQNYPNSKGLANLLVKFERPCGVPRSAASPGSCGVRPA
jgi:hypothetical protein